MSFALTATISWDATFRTHFQIFTFVSIKIAIFFTGMNSKHMKFCMIKWIGGLSICQGTMIVKWRNFLIQQSQTMATVNIRNIYFWKNNHNLILNKYNNYLSKSSILSLDHWCNVYKFSNNIFDCNDDNWQSLYKGRCNKDSIVDGAKCWIRLNELNLQLLILQRHW